MFRESFNIFATHERIMTIWGTWPKRSKSLWTLRNQLGLAYVVSVALSFFAFFYYKVDESLTSVSQSLTELSEMFLMMTKFTMLIYHKDKFVEIIDKLNKFFKKMDRLDDCKGIAKKIVTHNRRLAKIYFYATASLVLIYGNTPLVYQMVKMWLNGPGEVSKFPVQAYYGSFVQNNVVAYSIATIFIGGMGTYLIGWAVNDALFISMIYDIGEAFKCVGRRLEALKEKKNLSTEEIEEALKDIIEDHITCIKLSSKLEVCLQLVLLCQFLGSLANISFQMIQYAMQLRELTQILKLMTFTIQNQFEMIGYYYFANQLSVKSEQIAYHVYDLEWYNQPVRVRKTLLRMLEQAQQPTNLTAGRFFSITLINYGKFLNLAYTMFTFLLSFADKK